MIRRFARGELYALVWDRPMTRLAAEFALSDVALHKICRKHDIPTPPLGYWAKKQHGKPVRQTPLPKLKDDNGQATIAIHEGAANSESEAMSTARAVVREALDNADLAAPDSDHPIVERTISKLAKKRADRTGIAHINGKGLIDVSVRPESAERTGRLLRYLAAATAQAGIILEARDSGAVWIAEGEAVSFRIAEAADKLRHEPTEAELKAVADWEAKREADRIRYGYDRDWGRPHIPKWEERFQGRLAVRLEEVRIRTENRYWGPTIRRVFADSKTQDVLKMAPRILATVVAIAVAKRENHEADDRRRRAEEEAARRRAEAECRAALEARRTELLSDLMDEHEHAERLKRYLTALRKTAGEVAPERVQRAVNWANARLEGMRRKMAADELEERLAASGAFDEDIE